MLTIEEAIRNYEESERINKELAKNCVSALAKNHNLDNAEKCRQMIEWLRELQERRKAPEIVFCKDCARHNVDMRDSLYIEKAQECPLIHYRGKAQGHEFDYQFCAYGKRAERRTE